MRFLFAHNNFPAQFRHLAASLVEEGVHEVRAIAALSAPGLPGVALEKYRPPAGLEVGAHPFARHFDAECRRAEQVMFAASALSAQGFSPDIVFAHCGWGEQLPLRAVFPNSRIVIYCEFYFRPEGQDVHFDPEAPRIGADGIVTLQCRNASTLLALAESDLGVSPTAWQRSTYPAEMQRKIRVAHEGIDTELARPNPDAQFTLPSGRVLTRADEVITYVSRDLERPRGYHIFMRALPEVLRARPHAQVVIIGGDGASYGPASPPGRTWREIFFDENREKLDPDRIHFLGRAPYLSYLSALQISRVHVYLTYPFVLSWSLLEAMSVGCRIVASDTSPLHEVMDENSGILTPFFDAPALAERIIEVLERPELFDDRAAAARRITLARFDKRDCVRRMRTLLGIY